VARNDFVEFIMELRKRGCMKIFMPSTKNPRKMSHSVSLEQRINKRERESKNTRPLSIRITTESITVESNSV